ncbi:unknown protein [Paenibacillus amylolyticus]|uniref:Uncharacterized protein n=1 Tax=Paenibacillus amylolyticus TaxID=1451 RepID=A0A100VPE3_PAEAM|nr:unknown protein [Paenibacillus amylolyticus]
MYSETGDLVTGRQVVTLHTFFVHELNLNEHPDHKTPSEKHSVAMSSGTNLEVFLLCKHGRGL